MNYYEHHLGDYMRDTAHLSMLEDAAYRRLLDAYYIRECALPGDLGGCCKLARASTKAEREAVAYVLREFFDLREDGHHQDRANREIARFKDKQEKAKRSANARWSKPTSDSGGSTSAMRTHSEGNAPRARPQSPVTSNQTPDISIDIPPATQPSRAPDGEPPDPGVPPTSGASRAGWLCKRLKRAGIPDVNPSNQRLLMLLQAGADDAEFMAAAGAAAGKAKPFAYVLAVVEGERQRAKSMAGEIHGGAMPSKQEALEVRNRSVAAQWATEMRAKNEAG